LPVADLVLRFKRDFRIHEIEDDAYAYHKVSKENDKDLDEIDKSDKDFKYFDTDSANPRIQPDRFYFASFTLALP